MNKIIARALKRKNYKCASYIDLLRIINVDRLLVITKGEI